MIYVLIIYLLRKAHDKSYSSDGNFLILFLLHCVTYCVVFAYNAYSWGGVT